MSCPVTARDLTGIVINSTGPLAVFVLAWIEVPQGVTFMDLVSEQMPVVSSWGSRFIVTSIPGLRNDAGYFLRAVASGPSTVTYRVANTNITVGPVTLTRTGSMDEQKFGQYSDHSTTILVQCR